MSHLSLREKPLSGRAGGTVGLLPDDVLADHDLEISICDQLLQLLPVVTRCYLCYGGGEVGGVVAVRRRQHVPPVDQRPPALELPPA